MSSVSPKIHFGLAENTEIDRIVIEWPDGKETELKNLKSNQHLKVIYEKESELPTNSKNKILPKKFETLVQQSPFIHRENSYDDFKEEILLPHKNSTLGPALAVGDLNGDDLEDYVVGGAIGQPAGIYVQQKTGNFEKINVPIFEKDKFYEDLGIALIDAEMPIVVIASKKGNYEKVVSNIQEVKARGGRLIAIVTEGDKTVKELADYYICLLYTSDAADE